MRQRLLRHRPFRLAIAAMVAFAFLVQALPALAAPLLLDSGICHAGGQGGGDTPAPAGTPGCVHCLLCHASPVATLPPVPSPRPIGVAVALRLALPSVPAFSASTRFAYSSRAPPAVG